MASFWKIDMNYEDIQVGAVYTFLRAIAKQDVLDFASLTGDVNKLHIDAEFGERSIFKKNIVHGMLAGSLFSTLVGVHCPGENGVYLSQTLQFRRPIFYRDTLEVRGTVLSKHDSIRIITLKTEILRDKEVLISGEARVRVTK
ncbi:MAG: hypothetical protein A3C90_00115 [Candidatus Magasanikbacteria bacterium RIFCSPHIGHO2_02_FULL_51_14]|uniref:MaoC-like domain-containing protein n=1 Tax=Candidatus Magasanikbacteria bacterium RIFCSPHIGHO2_02_FULL_51_14 TaxID=1798683 RepID=A0A1F6MD09_9BACT|nr:MAG: hypothetical protein A3C90_00115 [Candidatus Magasanikbacteria bacterium RIFCSPHIGHO2_02_FULL_51_14]